MKIVLVGYMASGKSSVGKILAEKLRVDFIDLDAYIELKEELSIPDIFVEKGEIYFRLKETEYLKELLNLTDNFVLSVGGGTPCYANNIKLITEKSQLFYLRASINTLYNRLKRQRKSRPMIANLKLEDLKEFIAKHLFERVVYYEQAEFTINTDEKIINEIVEEIKELI
ncbi:MAG: shikimate kinase [Flavobacteriaceae bacterium]|nr:shikimate kinase [Flavobacteriaceae bacterium]